jgi:hypothetical protein
MKFTTCSGKRLSDHQLRVLAALLALESKHGWRWWPRTAIGFVVGAGGYHGVIQRSTMSILKEAWLVKTERASFGEELCDIVRCTCACSQWGLRRAGRSIAESAAIRWPPDAVERVASLAYHRQGPFRDEDEGWGDDGDDDDPGPLSPVGSGDLIHA